METLVVGRITAVFGVRGWVKVHSYTQQLEAVFDYQPWWIDTPDGRQQVLVDDWKRQSDGLVVHIKGVDDRDIARAWCQQDILVDKSLLPVLSNQEFYWHQLEGLAVTSFFEGQEIRLGLVKSLLETGANDVLVIAPDREEGQNGESSLCLIPFVDQYILEVDAEARTVTVAWDADWLS